MDWRSWKLAHDLRIEAVDRAIACIGDQLDLTLLPGLETHRRAGGDVEAEAFRGRPIEAKRLVGLEEVVVRAHLDGPVAGVGHLQPERGAAGVDLDVIALAEHFAGIHGDLTEWDGGL